MASIKEQFARLEQLAAQVLAIKLPWQTAHMEPYANALELSGALSSEPVDMHLPLFDEFVANPAITEAENYLKNWQLC